MTSQTCRAKNPLTCRTHGAALANSLLLPGRTVRGFGLAPEALQAYAEATKTMKADLSGREDSALHYYTGTGYSYVNGWLRRGVEGMVDAEIHDHYRHIDSPENRAKARRQIDDDLVGRIQRDVAALDSIFERVQEHAEPHVLYKAYRVRSTLNPDITSTAEIEDYVTEHYPVGKVFHNRAYTSTSIDPDYMLVHARRRPTQIIVHEIVTNKGLPLHDPMNGSIQSAEREMLLPRDMRLQVVNVTQATFKHSGLGPNMNHWGKRVPQRKRFTVIQFREV